MDGKNLSRVLCIREGKPIDYCDCQFCEIGWTGKNCPYNKDDPEEFFNYYSKVFGLPNYSHGILLVELIL